jgi:hypothetical protein
MSMLDAVRVAEHTGEDRCWPCTAVNAVVVVLAAGVAAVLSPVASVVVLLGGALAVYLRGYVVPGTPSFAPRLVAALGVESLFDHAGVADGGRARQSDDMTDGDADGEAVIRALFRAGVLREDADGLFLADDFQEAWRAEMASLRDLDDASLADAVADAAPFEGTGEPAFGGVSVDGDEGSVWLSRAYAVADTAAVRALAEAGVPERLRAQATPPLRMLLETCPECGGQVVETTETDCCGGTAGVYDSPGTEVLACDDCGAVVYEFDDEPAESA